MSTKPAPECARSPRLTLVADVWPNKSGDTIKVDAGPRIRFSGVAFQAQIEIPGRGWHGDDASTLSGRGSFDGNRIHGGGSTAAMAAPHPKLAPASASRSWSPRCRTCQQIKDDAARLACYDRSVSALTAAERAGRCRKWSTASRCGKRGGRCSASRSRSLPFFSNSKDKDVQTGTEGVVSTIPLVPGPRQRLCPLHHRQPGIDLGVDRTDGRPST